VFGVILVDILSNEINNCSVECAVVRLSQTFFATAFWPPKKGVANTILPNMERENFIEGVHNYCDRWCERCAFTSRCAVFAKEKEYSDEQRDPESPEFWDLLRKNFQDALDQLQDMIAKFELSDQQLNELADEADPDSVPEKSHPDKEKTVDISIAYSGAVDDFFENNEHFFFEQGQAHEEQIDAGEPIDFEKLEFSRGAIETIRWYQHFIGAKIDRAMGPNEGVVDRADAYQTDANGSAKVAMIAIQRSNDAWAVLAQHFPDKAVEINLVRGFLARLRDLLSAAFPDWERFHRPGFDDHPEAVMRLDFNPN
jgi:hypothetical protein